MPVGTTDYRARLRGPGSQDVIGFMLRMLTMPGGQQAPDATPADPATGKALQEVFGIPAAEPKRESRPDEKAAEVDLKAREAHRKLLGLPEPQSFTAPRSKPSSEEQVRLALAAFGVNPTQMELSEVGPANMDVRASSRRAPHLAPASGESFSERITPSLLDRFLWEHPKGISRNIQDMRTVKRRGY